MRERLVSTDEQLLESLANDDPDTHQQRLTIRVVHDASRQKFHQAAVTQQFAAVNYKLDALSEVNQKQTPIMKQNRWVAVVGVLSPILVEVFQRLFWH